MRQGTLSSWVVRAVVLGAIGACSSPPLLNVEVSPGLEEGALLLDPAVTRIDLRASTPAGDDQVVRTTSAKPGGSFDLGELPDDLPVTFELTGVAADGSTVARGRSISVPVGSVSEGQTLPLFIQRLGGFARPLGNVVRSHVRAPGGVFQERYLMLTGGDSASDAAGPQDATFGDFYDLLAMAGADGKRFPRVAKSLVVRDTQVLTIDDTGASWTDLSAASSVDATAPTGLAFGDVAGGAAIETPSGETWIVGATRDANPTAAILVVGKDAALSAKTLLVPRAGAAATWVSGTGLVVVGGSDVEPGVEVVPESGAAASAVPYPGDATAGAGLVPGVGSNVTVVGGVLAGQAASTRSIDLTCAVDCVPVPVGNATVDTIASRARAFLVAGATLLVGDDPTGETRAFLVTIGASDDTTSSVELPLRERRIGATPVAAPNGTLVIMGGDLVSGGPATTVEMYFPE